MVFGFTSEPPRLEFSEANIRLKKYEKLAKIQRKIQKVQLQSKLRLEAEKDKALHKLEMERIKRARHYAKDIFKAKSGRSGFGRLLKRANK